MLENRRKVQRIVESFGIIHEDSLLNSEVLKQNDYRRIQALKTNTTSESVLPYWLGLNSITILRQVIWTLKDNFLKSKKLPSKADIEPTLNEDDLPEEEEWDKEDVEEIEGNTVQSQQY